MKVNPKERFSSVKQFAEALRQNISFSSSGIHKRRLFASKKTVTILILSIVIISTSVIYKIIETNNIRQTSLMPSPKPPDSQMVKTESKPTKNIAASKLSDTIIPSEVISTVKKETVKKRSTNYFAERFSIFFRQKICQPFPATEPRK